MSATVKKEPGLHIFPAGADWSVAFQEARVFMDEHATLEKRNAPLCLGPHIGPAGSHYIHQKLLKDPILFGKRIWQWDEWIKDLAQKICLDKELPFHTIHTATKREYLRILLTQLDRQGLLPTISNLWKEQLFFHTILDCIDEFRMAGFFTENLYDQITSDGSKVETQKDLWTILLAWEKGLKNTGYCDLPAALDIIKEHSVSQSVFLLGFEKISPLEIDFIRSLSKSTAVFLPLAASMEEIEHVLSDLSGLESRSTLHSLSLLHANGVDLKIHSTEQASPTKQAAYSLLSAQTPMEEARASAYFLKDKVAQIISPPDFFTGNRKDAFLSTLDTPHVLGMPVNNILESELLRLIIQSLCLLTKNYLVDNALDFARLLATTRKNSDFLTIPPLALESGIIRGMDQWENLAKTKKLPIVSTFVKELKSLGSCFPEKGTSTEFTTAFHNFYRYITLTELIQNPPEEEQNVHHAFTALFSSMDLLSSETKAEVSLEVWLEELQEILTLNHSPSSYSANHHCFAPGEWLPPQTKEEIRLFLNCTNAWEPKDQSHFLTPEKDRTLLAGWGLVNYKDQDFLHWFQNASAGKGIFSHSHLDEKGKEQSLTYALKLIPTVAYPWPATDFLFPKILPPVVDRDFSLPDAVPSQLSPSTLDSWLKCPFRTLVERTWYAEDKIKNSTLDLSPIETGMLLHRALELFFPEGKGKKDWKDFAKACLESAKKDIKLQYYKGGENLYQLEFSRLENQFLNFLQKELDYLEEHPQLDTHLCEENFSIMLNNIPLKGKIDRIDVDSQSKNIIIVDYKLSTTPSTRDVLSHKVLQLPIYMDAMEKSLEKSCVGAYYLSLKDGQRNQGILQKKHNKTKDSTGLSYYKLGPRAGSLLEEDRFLETREKAQEEILSRSDAILSGDYGVRPDDRSKCSTCYVRPACRIRENTIAPTSFSVGNFSQIPLQPPAIPPKASPSPKQFSPEQEEALETTNKLVFLEASAGSGKTTILIERYQRTLEALEKKTNLHTAVNQILALSFTEKSAKEIRARVSELLSEKYNPSIVSAALKNISTIHGFNRKILQEFHHMPFAEILSETEERNLREEAIVELFTQPELSHTLTPLTKAHYSRKNLEDILRNLLEKRSLLDFDRKIHDLSSEIESEHKSIINNILLLFDEFCRIFDQLKTKPARMDKNDLERLAHNCLKNIECRNFYQKKYKSILVDEFQDTNSVQRSLLESIAQPGLKNIFVVGDAKQSIYRFRAADVSVFQNLKKTALQKGIVRSLNTNYRSQENIVSFGNILCKSIFSSENEEKKFEAQASEISAHHKPLDPVYLLTYEGGNAQEKKEKEGEILCKLIKKLHAQGKNLASIAILFQRLKGNEAYTKALEKENIPFVMGSQGSLFHRQSIIDGISLLRVLYSPSNTLAFLALLRSPWCQLNATEIHSHIKRPPWEVLKEIQPWLFELQQKSLYEKPSTILQIAYKKYPQMEYFNHRSQVEKLISLIENLEKNTSSPSKLLEQISSYTGWGREDDAQRESTIPEITGMGDAVQIFTIHGAKGLEFPITILPDLDTSIRMESSIVRYEPGVALAVKVREHGGEFSMPESYKNLGAEIKERDIAEKKRLLYVATTRAEKELYCILPPLPPPSKAGKTKDSWSAWLHGTDFKDSARKIPAEEFLKEKLSFSRETLDHEITEEPILEAPPTFEAYTTTELASYIFCPEFHRLKFIQGWSHKALSFWEASVPKQSPSLSGIFKILGVTNKIRGIAIHKVLEQTTKPCEKTWEQWLEQSYGSQGIPCIPELKELIRLDIVLLTQFMDSELGRKLFSPQYDSFPEIPFLWKRGSQQVKGTVDRIVRLSPKEWIIADYKVTEQKASRQYTFQMQGYMEALAQYLEQQKEKNVSIQGYIVNLLTGTLESISRSKEWGIEEQQAIREQRKAPSLRQFPKDTQACTDCPYISYCPTGRNFMLNFS